MPHAPPRGASTCHALRVQAMGWVYWAFAAAVASATALAARVSSAATRPTFKHAGDFGHTLLRPSPSLCSIGYPEWDFIIQPRVDAPGLRGGASTLGQPVRSVSNPESGCSTNSALTHAKCPRSPHAEASSLAPPRKWKWWWHLPDGNRVWLSSLSFWRFGGSLLNPTDVAWVIAGVKARLDAIHLSHGHACAPDDPTLDLMDYFFMNCMTSG